MCPATPDFNPRYARAAGRGWFNTGYQGGGVGFRVARTLTP